MYQSLGGEQGLESLFLIHVMVQAAGYVLNAYEELVWSFLEEWGKQKTIRQSHIQVFVWHVTAQSGPLNVPFALPQEEETAV